MANALKCRETLLIYLKARIPFITLRTDERARALELLKDLAAELSVPIAYHTLSNGARDVVSGRVLNEDRSIAGALDFAAQQFHQRGNYNFVLTEIQDVSDDSATSRQLLDVVSSASDGSGCVVLITTSSIWPRLQRMGMSVTLDPPDQDEMQVIIESTLADYRGSRTIEWGEAEIREAATVLAGVTHIEAVNAISTFVARGAVTKANLAELSQVKDRVFSDIAGLERVAVSADGQVVGGLAGLRSWLTKTRPLLTADLRERSLRPPRGVLLVGVPGCGKSLSAKAVAADWQLPLYRLDLANIHGQYLGQSEGRLKESLATADRVAPCVLWIDEIEKGLAGAGGNSDGGSATRLLGHFLYWLQEARARVFVVATANDIASLPPELFRRGRFDELFFVDLPSPEEREEIIGLYVKRYRLPAIAPALMTELVALSNGFTGADIEAAARELAYEEVRTGGGSVTDEAWREVFANTQPLTKTNPESIETIRAWGLERATPASGVSDPHGGARRGQRNVLA